MAAHYAEALRIRAQLLTLKGDTEGAERAYIASLDWARKQQAKSWELRTATSYARLMLERGREREAREKAEVDQHARLTFAGNPLSPTGRRPKGLFSNDEASGATRTAKVTFAGNSAGGDGAGGTAVRS